MTVKVSVDEYLTKVYVPKKYNCFHFAAEVWQDLTGQSLIDLFGDAIQDGVLNRKIGRHFTELPQPVDPCIVMFQIKRQSPHIGIYLRGKVLHIRSTGARFEPLHFASLGFQKIRYVQPC